MLLNTLLKILVIGLEFQQSPNIDNMRDLAMQHYIRAFVNQQLLSSADNLCKQFGPDLDPNRLTL